MLQKSDILTSLNERLDKLELQILTVEIEKDKLQKEKRASMCIYIKNNTPICRTSVSF